MALVALAASGSAGAAPRAATASVARAIRPAVADAQTKSKLRKLASHAENCFALEQSFLRCKLSRRGTIAGRATGVSRRDISSGRVAMVAFERSYTLTGRSTSGNVFVINRTDDGNVTRTCTNAGRYGCSSIGLW